MSNTLNRIDPISTDIQLLSELGRLATSGAEMDTALPRMAEQMAALIQADASAITLWNSATQKPIRLAAFGIDPKAYQQALNRPKDIPSLTAMIVSTGKAYIINDARQTEAPTTPFIEEFKAQNLMALPLFVRGHVIGAAFLLRIHDSRPFVEEDTNRCAIFLDQIALFIDNRMLVQDTHDRLAEKTALLGIAAITSATMDVDEMLAMAVRESVTLIDAAAGMVTMPDKAGLNLVLHTPSAFGLGDPPPEITFSMVENGHINHAYQTGVVYFSNDPDSSAEIVPAERILTPFINVISYPLNSRNRTLGVLTLMNRKAGPIGDSHIELVKAITSQVAVSVESALLFSAERERADLMATINTIGQELTSVLDLNALQRKVASSLRDLLHIDAVYVMALDETAPFVIVAAVSSSPDVNTIPVGQRYSVTKSIVGQVLAAQSSRYIADTQEEGVDISPNITPLALSAFAIPLRSGSHNIGALLLLANRTNALNQTDIAAVETLATQIATTIENANLYNQAQRRLLEQGIVQQIGQDLAALLDYDALTSAVVIHMARALDTDQCAFLRYLPDDHILRVDAEVINGIQQAAGTSFPLEHYPFIEQAIETRNPINIPAESDAQYTELIMPLVVSDQVIGVIRWVDQNNQRRFAASELRLAGTLTTQAAVALARALLYQRELNHLRQLEDVQVGGRLISAELRLKSLLERVAQETGRIFEADAVSVNLKDESGLYFVPHAVFGLSERYVRDRRIPVTDLHEMPTDWIYMADIIQQSAGQQVVLQREQVRSMLLTPLAKGGISFGTINVYSKNRARTFSFEEIELLQLLAGQVAVTYDNAYLFEELEKHARELEEANRLKSEFLTTISHELRTPMNSIIGFSDTLIKGIYGPLEDRQQNRMERILRNAQNLLALIDDLLDISKIDAGKMQLTLEKINLRDELDAAVYVIESQALKRGLTLTIVASPETPPVIADSLRLRQIINNLLGNAVKFTHQGGITITVDTIVENDRKLVRCAVEDSGIGIAPSNQSIIFDEFRQVDGSTTREYGGTGLGLAITRRLVQMMGGRITVNSVVGQGSTFTFVLPAG